MQTTGNINNDLRFPGQIEDRGTGLYYNNQRYYEPETGRYITADPIGLQGGLNPYAYVGGNPLLYSDPTGEIYPALYGAYYLAELAAPHIARFVASRLGQAAIASISTGLEVDNLTSTAVDGTPVTGGACGVATKSTSKELTTFFPHNNGFLGSPTKATLQPGQTIDRFGGSDVSRFFSPTGTPAAMRALPPGTAQQPLRTFEVLKPIGVESGQVAPAFNQIGLGTQFRSNKQLGELLEQGFLREVTK